MEFFNNEKEENYLPEEIGEPKWIDSSEDNYPEDLEPVDKNGKSKEDIFEEFNRKYGLLEIGYITFNKEKKEWQINGKDPSLWKEEEDESDEKWKHDRFH